MTDTARRSDQAHDEGALLAALLAGAVLVALTRTLDRQPGLAILCLAVLAAAAGGVLWLRARVLDRLASRGDPPAPGVVVGSVRGPWWLARRRPFRLPWAVFPQHVLIDGPTGRGKTYTFMQPLLRAHVARPDTGVFYLDGKGDPIHRPGTQRGGTAVAFDHVFEPEDPAASAGWNPLAGPDPARAASLFAAALFPEAATTGGTFYDARAVYVLTRVAAALALTAHPERPGDPAEGIEGSREPSPSRQEAGVLVSRLAAAGVPAEGAERLVRKWPQRCATQLDLLAHRDPVSGEQLVHLIAGDARPPRGAVADAAQSHSASAPAATEQETLGAAAEQPANVTPAALARAIFDPDRLASLHADLVVRCDAAAGGGAEHAELTQLAGEIAALSALPAKERGATLANLQNRLGHFLQPPFLELCSRSDFRVADVTRGARLAFLLPAGSFPTAAPVLGRVALAQFRHAVLASRPGVMKIAVLDEFHNFLSPDFAAFLAQARSRGGGAIMALQTLAAIPREDRDALLANISTVILTPGCKPLDADYWSQAFGEHPRARRSLSYPPAGPFALARRPAVRVELRDEPRYTPTQITELDAGQALIQVTAGRRSFPAAIVNVERDA